MENALKSLKTLREHEAWCHATDEQTKPVRDLTKSLLLLRKGLAGIGDGRLDSPTMDRTLAFDFKAANKTKGKLLKVLNKIKV